PTAVKFFTASGPHSCHRPASLVTGMSVTGFPAVRCATRKRRMRGFFEFAIASLALAELASDHSMLDWPLHTHTAPTYTSLSVTLLVPAIVSVYGPPALCSGNVTSHLPSRSATVPVAWAAPPSP